MRQTSGQLGLRAPILAVPPRVVKGAGCLTVLGEPHARGDRASEVDLEIVLDNRLENI